MKNGKKIFILVETFLGLMVFVLVMFMFLEKNEKTHSMGKDKQSLTTRTQPTILTNKENWFYQNSFSFQ